MSCKSGIYTVMNNVVSVHANGVIPLGGTIRRFGRNIYQSSDGIILNGDGYYKVDVSVTLNPTVAGTVSVNLLKDGINVVGGTASGTVGTENTPINLSIECLIRNKCCEDSSSLSLELVGGNAGVNNVAFVVTKI